MERGLVKSGDYSVALSLPDRDGAQGHAGFPRRGGEARDRHDARVGDDERRDRHGGAAQPAAEPGSGAYSATQST